ncbi:germination protein [Vallitalea longa]|uniref:Germination protein n=1 Tax=Vallitalea longa TaxID=2936439 RepID=A0A9W6DH40_9FIRM|nr:Ger(x)C family spore germination protein [Vallitalea longa]GKX31053.1 germination protein [Vallitalea longa]
MKVKVPLIIMIIVQMLLLTSCWSKKELDEISILSGVGIDSYDEENLLLTMQVILHREMKIESQTGKRGEESPTQNIEAIGGSLIDANRNFVLQTGRHGYWPHIAVIVIGEEQARKGISPILDILERDHEIRQRTYLLVTKDKAKDILMAETVDLEVIQAYNIKDMIENSYEHGESAKVDLHKYYLMSSEKNNSCYVTGINTIKDDNTEKVTSNLELKDTGIFKENKLIGWFDSEQTRGLLWIIDELNSCVSRINYPKDKKDFVFIETLRSKTKVKPVVKNDNLEKIVIDVSSQNILAQANEHIDLTKVESLDEIEKELEHLVKTQMESSLVKGKELNADVFGFGEIIHKYEPELWKEIKEYWEDIFLTTPIEINVDMNIKRTGLISKSKKDEGM